MTLLACWSEFLSCAISAPMPGILRAVESGDPFKVYRRLSWARLTGGLKEHRQVVDTLLAQRRLFAKPLGRTPYLGTFNSIGLGLVGNAELDSRDGTYVSTHAFVILFAMPLFPFGAYLVRPESNQGLSSNWTLFARVPLASWAWLYGRAVALGIAALVALAGARAVHGTRHQDVHVLNGFEVPLEVTFGEQRATVAPHGFAVMELPVGERRGRAEAQGVEVDTIALNVRSELEGLVWNVAGAGPLLERDVLYVAEGSPAPKEGDDRLQIHCGRKVLEVPRADHFFEPPPSSVQMGEREKLVRRHLVGLDPGTQRQPDACLHYLLSTDRSAEALTILEAKVRLSNWEFGPTSTAIHLASTVSRPEAQRLAREALKVHPDSLDLHRLYQHLASQAEDRAVLLAEYQERARLAPDSAQDQYLAARLLSPLEAGPAMEALALRYPNEPSILRSAVYWRGLRGRWSEVVTGWEHLRGLREEDARLMAESQVLALLRLGRGREGLTLLHELFESAPKEDRVELAVLRARVAKILGEPKPEALIEVLEAEGAEGKGQPPAPMWWARSQRHDPTRRCPGARVAPLEADGRAAEEPGGSAGSGARPHRDGADHAASDVLVLGLL